MVSFIDDVQAAELRESVFTLSGRKIILISVSCISHVPIQRDTNL